MLEKQSKGQLQRQHRKHKNVTSNKELKKKMIEKRLYLQAA